MKLFCEDCKKTFQVSDDAVSAGKAACPDCSREYSIAENDAVFPGRVIGDFVIESTIGKGGMGEIYLARQISLDRKVALKILQDRFTGDSEYVEGLFREARAAAKVSHPNIVQAYAVGEEDGIFYFAMELIRGETFKQILKREKTIAPERALKVIREIASAIDAAWREQKLVHQDIKPDNIMLDANGFAKLADLGLARKAGVNDEHAQVGDEVLGTPQYISPEQLTGVPTDVRSDIYSLGATFYQMVTGRYAYVADTVEEMSRMHVDGNLEPPNTVNKNIPESVNNIIMKMMARNIEERYQEPQELIRDIEDALRSNLTSSKKNPPSLSLKLKRPGTAQDKKNAAPVAPAGVKKAASAAPVAPVAPVAPAGVKKAAPAVPVAPVAPVAPAGVKKAAPAAPVAPAGVKKAEPVSPAASAEPQKPAPEEDKKNEAEVKTPDTPSGGQESTQSVRSALIAKQSNAEASEEDKQEVEEIIASAPGKKSKKILMISLISAGVVFILLFVSAIVFVCCADKQWMPPFAKPAAVALQSRIKEWGTGVTQKLREKLKKKEPQNNPVPEKIVPQTRKDYLNKVEELLTVYRNNPDDKKQWHALVKPELEYLLAHQTAEEQRAVKPLILIWHRVDELIVFAPYRNRAQEKHLEKLRKIEEEKRLAQEAEEQKRLREEKRKAEELAQNEMNRKRVEQERKANLAKLKSELDGCINPLAEAARGVFRGEDGDAYESALQNAKQYIIPHVETVEEKQAIDLYKKNLRAITVCVDDFRKFVQQVADVSDHGVAIRIKTTGNRRQLVQMLGISADGMLKYKPYGGKIAESRLKNQRTADIAVPLRKQIDNVDFYLLLMSDRSSKVLKKQFEVYLNGLKAQKKKTPEHSAKVRKAEVLFNSWKIVLDNFSKLF